MKLATTVAAALALLASGSTAYAFKATPCAPKSEMMASLEDFKREARINAREGEQKRLELKGLIDRGELAGTPEKLTEHARRAVEDGRVRRTHD